MSLCQQLLVTVTHYLEDFKEMMLSVVYTLAFEVSFYLIKESVLELREAIILIFFLWHFLEILMSLGISLFSVNMILCIGSVCM